MSAITEMINKKNIAPRKQLHQWAHGINRIDAGKVSEAAWGVCAFALFLPLGPFSAVATLFGLATLARQVDGPEPERV